MLVRVERQPLIIVKDQPAFIYEDIDIQPPIYTELFYDQDDVLLAFYQTYDHTLYIYQDKLDDTRGTKHYKSHYKKSLHCKHSRHFYRIFHRLKIVRNQIKVRIYDSDTQSVIKTIEPYRFF